MANEIRPTDAFLDVDLSEFEVADTERPPPMPVCAAVRGGHAPADEGCAHGECDACQTARGEDPVNYAGVPRETTPEQLHCAAFDTLLSAAKAVTDLHEQGEMAPSLLEKLTDAVDAIIDPATDERRLPRSSAESCGLPPVQRSALPSDSAARKRVPLCTGVYDYFPDALYAIVDSFDAYLPDALPDPDLVSGYLSYLAIRGQEPAASTIVSWYALCILQNELTGHCPTHRPQTEAELFDSFAEALVAVAEVSWYGNEKHNPGQPLHHARGKSNDHPDCALRHLLERGGFDGPLRHSACLAWRSLAMGQAEAEANGAPLARGARLPTPDTGDAP